MASSCDSMLMFLHESFVAFNEVLTTEGNCWDICKTKLQQLQEQWQQKGLFGVNALSAITKYQEQINWKEMSPEQFGRFYRFTFYICRDVGKRNIPMDLAVAAWRLIMPGRFRLLDRWCAFAASSSARVVTEDTWRQVLEFSRTIHEDLSNYDAAGAWAVLLDEFVEELRSSSRRRSSHTAGNDSATRLLYGGASGADLHQLARAASSGSELAARFASGDLGGPGAGVAGSAGAGGLADGGLGLGLGLTLMASISPRCGSKRREPDDVDVVAEQLSAMPLGAEHRNMQHQQYGQQGQGGPVGMDCGGSPYSGYSAGALAKRQCVEHFGSAPQHAQETHSGCAPEALPGPASQSGQEQQQQQQQQQRLLQEPQTQPRTEPHSPSQLFAPHHQRHQQQQCGGLGTPGGIVQPFPSGLMAGLGPPFACTPGSAPGPGPGPKSGVSQEPGQAIVAAMEFAQDVTSGGAINALHQQQQQQPSLVHMNMLQQQQHCQQQRRAIKARRSGLSDIVKSAVSDALGF